MGGGGVSHIVTLLLSGSPTAVRAAAPNMGAGAGARVALVRLEPRHGIDLRLAGRSPIESPKAS